MEESSHGPLAVCQPLSIKSHHLPHDKQNNIISKSHTSINLQCQSIANLENKPQSNHNEPQQDQTNEQTQCDDNKETIFQTQQLISINRNDISFGKGGMYPGSIKQIDVDIRLKNGKVGNNQSYMLRVIATCLNEQFDQLDQYVFSVCSNERYEYFEEIRFKIKQQQKVRVKFAIKIPSVSQKYVINGCLKVQLQNLQPIFIPVTAVCQVPSIISIKSLYKLDENAFILKIPAKKNQSRMPPLPFKNLYNSHLVLEVQAISHQATNNQPYNIIAQSIVNCQANSQFFVNIQLKQNPNYFDVMPKRHVFRRILILKIKNSSVYYHFPMQIQIFEGTNNNSIN